MVSTEKLQWIFSVPVGGTISIFGLLGNVLSVIVWGKMLKKKNRGNKSTATYLISLALADIGLLIFFLLTNTLPKTFPHILKTYIFCVFHSYVGFPGFFFFVVLSIWLIVAVTLNRFLMAIFPLKAKRYCSTSRAYIGIGSVFICTFLINIPHFMNYRPASLNGTYQISETDYVKSGKAQSYEFWVHCIFLVLGPWISIAFFNAGIIYALLRRTKTAIEKLNTSKSRSSHDRQMTCMLLAVTFSFLILLAWQCISQCFYMLGFGSHTDNQEFVKKSFAVAKLGVVINSSINFVLYCCTGSVFLKEIVAFLTYGTNKIHSLSSTIGAGRGGTKEIVIDVDSKTSNT